MSRPRVVLGLTALLVLVVAAGAWVRPLTRERTPTASTGAPVPVNEITPIPLPPDGLMCASDIVLGPRMQEVELVVTGDKPVPPLVVRAHAPGYTSPAARISASDPGTHPVGAVIDPPPKETLGRLCVRNAGRTAAIFVGTTELRTYTKLRTFVDGEPLAPDVALKFYERRQVSVLGDLPAIVHRATIGRGFLGAAWIVWILLALVAVVMPLLVLRALHGALTGPSAVAGRRRRDEH